MRKPLTGEDRERAIQEILSEHPSVTREQVEEWASMGRPARPGEIEARLDRLYQEGLRKKIPHPDPSVPGLVIR